MAAAAYQTDHEWTWDGWMDGADTICFRANFTPISVTQSHFPTLYSTKIEVFFDLKMEPLF